ncbi:YdeI/OmpD-associated family protein [Anaerotalea alkaliphila]|uniref:Bacteriocin-protection protein n=1 Tax=Anaerotalea alkaliphila TaxID=2662126 RepID=A0A7X5KP34_9FIRM|nr:YdeI/OmpD-associated family protein [Anaerotalea alkaliphila]NDL68478.1 hypothetical protein [Anaerotalea alkaliphila]
MADSIKTVYFSDRKEWRHWLEQNFEKEQEVWLIYPHKNSGKPRIAYNDAVEEALCFGWIDSTVRSLDENSSMQRFTPRKPKSGFSQPNKERIKWLLKNSMVHPSIIESVRHIPEETFVFPEDIVIALKADEEVWEHFQTFPPAYRRIRIAYIESARKRPEEFDKRLKNFIQKTRKNKMIGFGGIEKYYE